MNKLLLFIDLVHTYSFRFELMEWINIKEAVSIYGKSDSYFRRLQREWVKSKPKKVKLIEGKVSFELNELNKKLDKRRISQRTSFDQQKNESNMLAILQRELDEKNELIRNLSETIKANTITIHNLTESVKMIGESTPKRKRWFW